MQVEAYLERIRYAGPRDPDAETLRRLHRAHMLAVPFENLDIHLGIPIVPSLPAFFEKIVGRRRGGFCYELNGLFAWLLAEMGFRVTLLSARVFSERGLSPDFDHLLLRVDLGDRWIADVGFGDSFLAPLRLDSRRIDEQQGRRYSLAVAGEEWTLRSCRPGATWESQFVFSLAPHRLDEFAARCRFHQTSPDSHFTRSTVASIATATGRITLSGVRLIVTTGETRRERDVRSAAEYRTHLATDLGIDLEEAAVATLVEGNVAV